MRLKKLQISGFKSFVDPTNIRLPADFVAVVGPNGCGKSNVIDAVRWVMGEASAKTLRGDQMIDVIFNGSSARKPVGKAAVELLFDNSDGSAGGSYAQFAEVSIKRTLSRDGNSNYFVNNSKARRKDVLDLFRGTGLGPRSYSIIEQGMVGRIVEARPDDLRLFVEEAAGTSKYKDRRRETENRMAHTRENLARVDDIRNELDKQLKKLKFQVESAEKFKALQDQINLIRGQLLVLQLKELEEQLKNEQRVSQKYKDALDTATAAHNTIEAELEKLRQQQINVQKQHSLIQQNYYQLGADIKTLENAIKHAHATTQLQSDELRRLKKEIEVATAERAQQQSHLSELKKQDESGAPRLQELQSQCHIAERNLKNAEAKLSAWQEEWRVFNEQSQTPATIREVQQSRIDQLQQHMKRANERIAQLKNNEAAAQRAIVDMDIEKLRDEVHEHDAVCERSETEFVRLENEAQYLQKDLQRIRDQEATARSEQSEAQSRLKSLRQIQAAALQSEDEDIQKWLRAQNLGSAPRLATQIKVAAGWERAADRLLRNWLAAVCVENLPRNLSAPPNLALTIIAKSATSVDSESRPKLLDKIDATGINLGGFLSGVYIAEELDQALELQKYLSARECVVTRDGVLVGVNWINFPSQDHLQTGVLARKEEIQQLQEQVQQLDVRIFAGQEEIAAAATKQEGLNDAVKRQRESLSQLRLTKTELHSNFGREESRYLEQKQRITDIKKELQELAAHSEADKKEIATAEELLKRAGEQRGALDSERNAMMDKKNQLEKTIDTQRDALHHAREKLHQHQLNQQKMFAELQTTKNNIERTASQISSTEKQLQRLSGTGVKPETHTDSDLKLQAMLDQHNKIKEQLNIASQDIETLQKNVDLANANRMQQADAVNRAREILQSHDLDSQGSKVRHDTIHEQLQQEGFDEQELRAGLPEDADAAIWQQQCDNLDRKIKKIGAVNLVALDEFKEAEERKEYLDKQNADLCEALETLTQAIKKIDRETKEKFKDTFEKLNIGFNEFFPRLFGGGKAELQLTSDDFLTTGVVVVAQPPGKRNSHISLLSGGEKALTAVALLFALFKLNPAPFCMLDEVDAPLDDANVSRYCETLKTLMKVSQMIVITHNKLTMETADVLIGVTMGEPGVSRLVSVDVEQAVDMVQK